VSKYKPVRKVQAGGAGAVLAGLIIIVANKVGLDLDEAEAATISSALILFCAWIVKSEE
jgi:hypothetical protein